MNPRGDLLVAGLALWVLLFVLAGATPANAADEPAQGDSSFDTLDASPAPEDEARFVPETLAPALRDGYRSEIERTWFEAGPDLAARAVQARKRALQLGAGNMEGPARALISPAASGDPLANAMLAVQIAPDLPLVHMVLARVYWDEGDRVAALEQTVHGLMAIPRHLEASLWLVGTLLMMCAAVMVLGSLALIVWLAASLFSHATHDIGDLISHEMPTFARVALLGSVVLLPVIAGEGAIGVVLACFVIALVYGGSRHRMALALAAVLLVLGMYPVARFAGIALTALDSDRVADATLSVMRGVDSPADLTVLEQAGESDFMAQHALATRARRVGLDDEAARRYGALLLDEPRDAVALTNLGNLRFEGGGTEAAIDLFERSANLLESPTLMFNLSQAYARGFRMEEFEKALKRAQRLGSSRVQELSRSGDPAFVADLSLPSSMIRNRMLAGAGVDTFARSFIQWFAPGRLGRTWTWTAGSFVAAMVLALLLSGRFERSSTCSRCGRRICQRCDGTVWNSEICDGCHRLFHRPETTDPSLRMARLMELRTREARLDKASNLLSMTVPGVGGVLAGRPDLCFAGILLFSWVVVSFLWRNGVVPDPLAVGAAGPLAFLIIGVAALLGYSIVVLAGLVIRRSQ